MIAKLVVDLLVAGFITRSEIFMADQQEEFELRKIQTGNDISFAGCDILYDEDA